MKDMQAVPDLCAKYLEMFKPKRVIDNPSDDKLREWAFEKGGVITEFGNLAVITNVRNRIAKFTEVVTGKPDPEDDQLIRKVLEYLRTKEVIQLDRVMCHTRALKGIAAYMLPLTIPEYR